MRKVRLPKVLPEPPRPGSVPENARWLSGEGAGSWFAISDSASPPGYKGIRFSPEGNIECDGVFIQQEKGQENIFCSEDPFEVTYPSNCKIITVIQHSRKFILLNRKGMSTDEISKR